MRVLGLDLSLTSTGVALPDGAVRRVKSRVAGMARLADLRSEILALAVDPAGTEHMVDLVAIEGYAFGRPNQACHLGELGGVIRLALYDYGVPYVDVPPATLKKFATGRGNASKEEMLVAAVKRLGYSGSSNDEADAMWLRECALSAYGSQSDGVGRMITKDQAATLARVEWPVLRNLADIL